MIVKPRTLFLVDGIGALVSAIALGVVLAYWHELIGLPQGSLRLLGAIPVLFAVYSLYHHLRFPENWPVRLQFIAVLNILYCGLSAYLMVVHFDGLTITGMTYFILEMAIVIPLAIYELNTAKSTKN